MGRPSKYKKEYAEQAYDLSLLGLVDKELATFFGVSEQTLNAWKKAHPEFLESLKKGKEPADGKVARKLYTEALAGNVTAMIFWLKNRQPAKWRDKPEVFDDDAPIPESIKVEIIDGRKPETE